MANKVDMTSTKKRQITINIEFNSTNRQAYLRLIDGWCKNHIVVVRYNDTPPAHGSEKTVTTKPHRIAEKARR